MNRAISIELITEDESQVDSALKAVIDLLNGATYVRVKSSWVMEAMFEDDDDMTPDRKWRVIDGIPTVPENATTGNDPEV